MIAVFLFCWDSPFFISNFNQLQFLPQGLYRSIQSTHALWRYPSQNKSITLYERLICFFLCLGVRFDAFTHFETLVALLLYSTEAVKQLFNFLHALKWKKTKSGRQQKRDRMKWNKCVSDIEAQFATAIINPAGLAHMTSHIVYFVRWTFGQ